jgi:hypothetical protein
MEFFVADEHSQLYDQWRDRTSKNLAVCHVDFHCDMRGLLIDNWLQKARFVWRNDPYMNRLDSGSFLAHAIMQGIVSRLRWVHDDFGGRKYDQFYCVKYETDLTALPYRLSRRNSWVSLNFEETTFDNRAWLVNGEHLCIDWDGIAYKDYDEDKIRSLMNMVLANEVIPESIFVAHSPEYCHSNKNLFNEFIGNLENKYKIQSIRLPAKHHLPVTAPLPWKIYHQAEFQILRQMRKREIY